jgi:glycosyltransferase involved in cell wall biosynthesis
MPAFNAANTIVQSLLSVIVQTHSEWKVIVRDDLSTDGTPDIARRLAHHLGLEDKIEIQVNTEKKWEVQNVLEMISQCKEEDIICRLDADDWLTDTDILTILNHRYDSEGFDAVWTAHRWGFSSMNISAPLPAGADVYSHPWVTSHFKTFRKSLISGISDENFRGQDGSYFKRIGDQAIYLPVLHRATKRLFEPIVAYHYTIDMQPETFQTEDARFQKGEAEYLRSRRFV